VLLGAVNADGLNVTGVLLLALLPEGAAMGMLPVSAPEPLDIVVLGSG